jgi:hypothetical protein
VNISDKPWTAFHASMGQCFCGKVPHSQMPSYPSIWFTNTISIYDNMIYIYMDIDMYIYTFKTY